MLVCDIFDLDGNPTAVLSEADKVDCVFDRAAFVAIRPEDRDRYVPLMRSLSADFNYLLIVEQYDDQKFPIAPPWSLRSDQVEMYFKRGEPTNWVTFLEAMDNPDVARRNGVEQMSSCAFLITQNRPDYVDVSICTMD